MGRPALRCHAEVGVIVYRARCTVTETAPIAPYATPLYVMAGANARNVPFEPVCTVNRNFPFAAVFPEKVVFHVFPTFFCSWTGLTN